MAKKLPSYFNCSIEFTLAVLGGKWKTMILCHLKRRPCRYSELRAAIPELSEKVLTERLKDLMAIGLVVQRKGSGKNATSVYALTAKGLSLTKLLHALWQWGDEHAHAFDVEVGDPFETTRNREQAERLRAR